MSVVSIVAGTVLRTEYRSGVSRASNEPYEMNIMHVLVANMGLTEVVLPRDLSVIGGELPRQGDSVAWVIETVRTERGLNVRVLGSASEALEQLGKPNPALAASTSGKAA